MEKKWDREPQYDYHNKQNQRDIKKDWDKAEFEDNYYRNKNHKDMMKDCNTPKYENDNHQKQYKKDTLKKKYSFDKDDNKSLVMSVTTSRIGLIIGKHGAKIKELQQNTGTRIMIGDPCKGNSSLTEVTIIGKSESQRECQRLINNLVGTEPSNYLIESTQKQEEDDILIDWDVVNEKAEQLEKERWTNVPPIKKDFYTEHPDVQKMSKKEVQEFRKNNNNIIVQIPFGYDGEILNPVTTFDQAFGSYPEILSEIKKMGFETPSPIQCQAWPILLSGRDLIGIAQTGTGKTLAFLLPALIHIDGQGIPKSERQGANVLVLAPTRELALQIQKEVQKYSYKDIKCVCVYGGGNRQEQMDVITKGVEIIIATPGRLNDLVEADVIDLTGITYLILDEADRMLDMGFEPQIRKVLLDIRPDRQSVMTSATWNRTVHRLAERYMNKPVQVYVGSLDLAAVHSVTQTVWIIEEDQKNEYLLKFIKNLSDDDKVIVFVGKKKIADFLSSDLVLKNISCQCIHGDREQTDREQALEDLKTGEVNILIATDVASRGLDILDVTKVFNYDFPKNIEEYIHRVGRTGRAGRTGEAVTLFTRADWAYADELVKIMTEANQDVPNELYDMRDRFLKQREKRIGERKYFNERGGRGRGRGGGRGRGRGGGEGGGYGGGRGGGGGGGYGGGRGGGGGGGGGYGYGRYPDESRGKEYSGGSSEKSRGYNRRY